MSNSNNKKLNGSIGVMYDNTHLTIYLNKPVNYTGAKKVFRIIEQSENKLLITSIEDIKEISLKKVKIK